MGLETGVHIDDLVPANPLGTDDRSTADDHLRLIKDLIKNTFPNITGEMSATHVELNKMDGCTATTAELNKLDGYTGGFAELNRLNSIAGNGSLDAFPAGTDMLFYQSAAPTGWTKNVTASLNDHALRIMTSGAWTAGTQGTTVFSTQFAQGFAGENFTLLETHIPLHTHHVQHRHLTSLGDDEGNSGASRTGTEETDSFGGSQVHKHNVNLGVKYLDMIIASKN